MHKAMFTFFVIAACFFPTYAFADDAAGNPAVQRGADYYYWTHFVNGALKTESGNTRFPVLNEVGQTKVAIFANNANDRTMELAKALDTAMQKYPQLRYSFMILGKESGTESMTDAQLADQLRQLRTLVERHTIEKLSIGCLQYQAVTLHRGRTSLKLLEGADIALAVIEPGILEPRRKEIGRRLPTRTVKPFYRYLVRFREADQDSMSADAKIEEALKALLQ